MSIFKLGQTIKFIIQCETDEEWSAIYPNELILAEARLGKSVTYEFTTTVDVASRSILFQADTSTWRIGEGFEADVKIRKNNENIYIPAGNQYINFDIVAPVANEAV